MHTREQAAIYDVGGATLLARVTRKAIQDLGLVPGGAVFAVIKTVTFDRGNVGAGRARAGGADA